MITLYGSNSFNKRVYIDTGKSISLSICWHIFEEYMASIIMTAGTDVVMKYIV